MPVAILVECGVGRVVGVEAVGEFPIVRRTMGVNALRAEMRAGARSFSMPSRKDAEKDPGAVEGLRAEHDGQGGLSA